MPEANNQTRFGFNEISQTIFEPSQLLVDEA